VIFAQSNSVVLRIPEAYWNGKGNFNGLGLAKLKERYVWPLSPKTSNYISDGSLFSFTENLKRSLHEAWIKAVYEEDLSSQKSIAEYIIKDWGGIKSLKEETLWQHIDLAKSIKEGNQLPSRVDLTGVASYSKLLSVADPSRFAIFDARVAVSLVAIQLLANVKSGTHLGFLSGRNNIVGNTNSKAGFSTKAIFRSKSDLFSGWLKPASKDVYGVYLALLGQDAAVLGVPMSHLEMALFTDAELLASICASKFSVDL